MLENIGNSFRHAHDLTRSTRVALHRRGLIEERFPMWWYITDKGRAILDGPMSEAA
jgi:anti-sigma regulatory factor (Ser/Thr protein kinase)